MRLLARAEHRLGTLSGSASRLLNPYLASAQMLRREAILSSRIEVTIATPEQIALVELGAEPRTDDAREVGNFVRAMECALSAADDGRRHDVIDGELFATPSPADVHQHAVGELYALLLPYAKRVGVNLLIAPSAVRFSKSSRGATGSLGDTAHARWSTSPTLQRCWYVAAGG